MDLDTQHNAQTQVPDYYDVLQCSHRSTQDQIHRSYRQLALQHHPDKTSSNNPQWDVIREAYETIGDDLKRAQYDRWRMSKLPVPFKQWVRSQAHAVHWAFDYQRAIQSDQKKWWDARERREGAGDLYEKFRHYEI